MSSPATKSNQLHHVAGNLALDLANTTSWRGTEREIDHLRDADAIVAWALDAGVVNATFAVSKSARSGLVQDIHNLRSAIDEAGAMIAQGVAPSTSALHVVHEYAARSFAAASLAGAPAIIEFAVEDAIIGPVAWSAVELLRGDELRRLRICPPDDCRWLFVDRSKNGSRRWCEMATCGNRAKTRSRR